MKSNEQPRLGGEASERGTTKHKEILRVGHRNQREEINASHPEGRRREVEGAKGSLRGILREARGAQTRQAFSLPTPPITLQSGRKAMLVVRALRVIEDALEF